MDFLEWADVANVILVAFAIACAIDALRHARHGWVTALLTFAGFAINGVFVPVGAAIWVGHRLRHRHSPPPPTSAWTTRALDALKHQTQIVYHDWNIRGGRFRCSDDRIELWFSRWDPGRWLYGLSETKTILFASISAIFRLNGGMIRMVFDDGDEIIVHQNVLRALPADLVSRRLLDSLDVRWMNEVNAMRARQAQRGDVSWELGRGGGHIRSRRSVKLREGIIAVVVIAFFVIPRLV